MLTNLLGLDVRLLDGPHENDTIGRLRLAQRAPAQHGAELVTTTRKRPEPVEGQSYPVAVARFEEPIETLLGSPAQGNAHEPTVGVVMRCDEGRVDDTARRCQGLLPIG